MGIYPRSTVHLHVEKSAMDCLGMAENIRRDKWNQQMVREKNQQAKWIINENEKEEEEDKRSVSSHTRTRTIRKR